MFTRTPAHVPKFQCGTRKRMLIKQRVSFRSPGHLPRDYPRERIEPRVNASEESDARGRLNPTPLVIHERTKLGFVRADHGFPVTPQPAEWKTELHFFIMFITTTRPTRAIPAIMRPFIATGVRAVPSAEPVIPSELMICPVAGL